MKIKFQIFKRKHLAFTLAEVLIVLAIIGVVAALTIPALMQSNQDNQYKVAYKKAFADLSNALNAATSDNSLVSRTSETDTTSNYSNYKQLESKFNVTKDCDSSNNSACWASGEIWNSSTPTSDAPAFIDNSGRAWSFRTSKSYGGATWTCYILVDTNGFKSPNIYGKDRFAFLIEDKLGNAYNMPEKIALMPDVSGSSGTCPSANCYYTSWIVNAK